MTRDRDPLHRSIHAYQAARRRVTRRVVQLLAYVDNHPDANTQTDPALRRLDMLLGQAGQLRDRL